MSQTKSKQRVTDHGEVFTAERKVNAIIRPMELNGGGGDE